MLLGLGLKEGMLAAGAEMLAVAIRGTRCMRLLPLILVCL
jgi:hypothetical protein